MHLFMEAEAMDGSLWTCKRGCHRRGDMIQDIQGQCGIYRIFPESCEETLEISRQSICRSYD